MPRLEKHPVHLGLGATARAEPAFTGYEWYEAYSARNAADGAEGRLVSQHSFSQSWDSWEIHPLGEEVVVCLAGRVTLIQQAADGAITRVPLEAGDYAINPRGVWHTADIAPDGPPCRALFITAGEGTQARPRHPGDGS